MALYVVLRQAGERQGDHSEGAVGLHTDPVKHLSPCGGMSKTPLIKNTPYYVPLRKKRCQF